jgi:DNA-binding transcriptional LysR family regulator
MLAEGHWILRERGSGTRSAFEASLRADGVDPEALDVVLTLPSNEAILSALGAGAYLGVASGRVAAAALAAGQLARLDYALRPRPFRMLWHKSRYLTRAARAFEAMLPHDF